MDLYDVMRTTFAPREFTGEPDRTLYRILDNARFAPSGGNRQAVRIIVVRDRCDRIAELSVPGARRYVAQLGGGAGDHAGHDAARPADRQDPHAGGKPIMRAGMRAVPR